MPPTRIFELLTHFGGRGTNSTTQRVQLLQNAEREFPWFRFLEYIPGRPGLYIVDCGSGPVGFSLGDVEVFIAGLRLADQHHTGNPASLRDITSNRFSPDRQPSPTTHL